jgi:hypothetical protein
MRRSDRVVGIDGIVNAQTDCDLIFQCDCNRSPNDVHNFRVDVVKRERRYDDSQSVTLVATFPDGVQ